MEINSTQVIETKKVITKIEVTLYGGIDFTVADITSNIRGDDVLKTETIQSLCIANGFAGIESVSKVKYKDGLVCADAIFFKEGRSKSTLERRCDYDR